MGLLSQDFSSSASSQFVVVKRPILTYWDEAYQYSVLVDMIGDYLSSCIVIASEAWQSMLRLAD
jgi:hypothetical protein